VRYLARSAIRPKKRAAKRDANGKERENNSEIRSVSLTINEYRCVFAAMGTLEEQQTSAKRVDLLPC